MVNTVSVVHGFSINFLDMGADVLVIICDLVEEYFRWDLR